MSIGMGEIISDIYPRSHSLLLNFSSLFEQLKADKTLVASGLNSLPPILQLQVTQDLVLSLLTCPKSRVTSKA